jgi:hypothetical protein
MGEAGGRTVEAPLPAAPAAVPATFAARGEGERAEGPPGAEPATALEATGLAAAIGAGGREDGRAG